MNCVDYSEVTRSVRVKCWLVAKPFVCLLVWIDTHVSRCFRLSPSGVSARDRRSGVLNTDPAFLKRSCALSLHNAEAHTAESILYKWGLKIEKFLACSQSLPARRRGCVMLGIVGHDIGRGTPNGSSGCSIPALVSWFYTTFLNNSGRGESLVTTTCRKGVVGVKQGHVKYFFTSKSNFCVSQISLSTYDWQSWGKFWHTQYWGYCQIVNSGVCLTWWVFCCQILLCILPVIFALSSFLP